MTWGTGNIDPKRTYVARRRAQLAGLNRHWVLRRARSTSETFHDAAVVAFELRALPMLTSGDDKPQDLMQSRSGLTRLTKRGQN